MIESEGIGTLESVAVRAAWKCRVEFGLRTGRPHHPFPTSQRLAAVTTKCGIWLRLRKDANASTWVLVPPAEGNDGSNPETRVMCINYISLQSQVLMKIL